MQLLLYFSTANFVTPRLRLHIARKPIAISIRYCSVSRTQNKVWTSNGMRHMHELRNGIIINWRLFVKTTVLEQDHPPNHKIDDGLWLHPSSSISIYRWCFYCIATPLSSSKKWHSDSNLTYLAMFTLAEYFITRLKSSLRIQPPLIPREPGRWEAAVFAG